MNTRLSRNTLLTLVAVVSASAALLAQPAVAEQTKADPYTQGAVAKADPYTDGAAAKYDVYTQGADRQADTYGYLSWNGDVSYPKGAASQA